MTSIVRMTKMKIVERMIDGKLVRGVLLNPTVAPKTNSVRPKPSKPVYGSRLPRSLENESK
jgi:hypothetical protein